MKRAGLMLAAAVGAMWVGAGAAWATPSTTFNASGVASLMISGETFTATCTACINYTMEQDGSNLGIEILNPTGNLSSSPSDTTISIAVSGAISISSVGFTVAGGTSHASDYGTSLTDTTFLPQETILDPKSGQLAQFTPLLNAATGIGTGVATFAAQTGGLTLSKDLGFFGGSGSQYYTYVKQDLNVSASSVPEPASALIMLSSLGLLVPTLRRRTRG